MSFLLTAIPATTTSIYIIITFVSNLQGAKKIVSVKYGKSLCALSAVMIIQHIIIYIAHPMNPENRTWHVRKRKQNIQNCRIDRVCVCVCSMFLSTGAMKQEADVTDSTAVQFRKVLSPRE